MPPDFTLGVISGLMMAAMVAMAINVIRDRIGDRKSKSS